MRTIAAALALAATLTGCGLTSHHHPDTDAGLCTITEPGHRAEGQTVPCDSPLLDVRR